MKKPCLLLLLFFKEKHTAVVHYTLPSLFVVLDLLSVAAIVVVIGFEILNNKKKNFVVIFHPSFNLLKHRV